MSVKGEANLSAKMLRFTFQIMCLLMLAGGGGVYSLCAAETPAADGKAQEGSFQYDAKERRDPFVALVTDGRMVGVRPGAAGDKSKPILYGILWDPHGQSIALVNNTEVKVGDRVGLYQVIEIRQDAVILTGGGGESVVLQIAFEVPSSNAPMGGEEP